jgi:hypothetical protein
LEYQHCVEAVGCCIVSVCLSRCDVIAMSIEGVWRVYHIQVLSCCSVTPSLWCINCKQHPHSALLSSCRPVLYHRCVVHASCLMYLRGSDTFTAPHHPWCGTSGDFACCGLPVHCVYLHTYSTTYVRCGIQVLALCTCV